MSEPGLRPFQPRRFGRFTLLAPLASGGMGQIYLAQARFAGGLEKRCVIKKVLPELARDEGFAARFRDEAQTLVQLQHGSIAQVYDSGIEAGEPWIAMELVDGKDLRRLLQRVRAGGRRIPLPIAVYIAIKLLEALAYAHRKKDESGRDLGLVHRDVSPQNVLLSYEGEVKVIDFGLARSTITEEHEPSVVMGKFHYMAPEQARNRPLDRRADLYAVGVILYEMITGWNPFEEASPVELLDWASNPRIPPVRRLAAEVPSVLAEALGRALAVDPDDRFSSAEEMRGPLAGCLSGLAPDAGPERIAELLALEFVEEYRMERIWMAALARGESAASPAAEETTQAGASPRGMTPRPPQEFAKTARFGEALQESGGGGEGGGPLDGGAPTPGGSVARDDVAPMPAAKSAAESSDARSGDVRPDMLHGGPVHHASIDTAPGMRAAAPPPQREDALPWDRDRSGASALRSAAAAASSVPRSLPWYESARAIVDPAIPAPEPTPRQPFRMLQVPGGEAAKLDPGAGAIPSPRTNDAHADREPPPKPALRRRWALLAGIALVAGLAALLWPRGEPVLLEIPAPPAAPAIPEAPAAAAPEVPVEKQPEIAAVEAEAPEPPAPSPPPAAPAMKSTAPALPPAPRIEAEIAAPQQKILPQRPPDRRRSLEARRRQVMRKYEELVGIHGADQIGGIVASLVRATDSQYQRLIADPERHDDLQRQLDELDRLLEERRLAFAP